MNAKNTYSSGPIRIMSCCCWVTSAPALRPMICFCWYQLSTAMIATRKMYGSAVRKPWLSAWDGLSARLMPRDVISVCPTSAWYSSVDWWRYFGRNPSVTVAPGKYSACSSFWTPTNLASVVRPRTT